MAVKSKPYNGKISGTIIQKRKSVLMESQTPRPEENQVISADSVWSQTGKVIQPPER